MNRHMQTATLLRRSVAVDELGEQIVSYIPALAKMEIAISVNVNENLSQVLTNI